MSSPQGPPPDGGDRDRGPYLVAILWVLWAIDVVFVAARFLGRRIIRSTGRDDWMMLFTLVLFTVHNGILTFDALNGGQRHLYYLTPDEISEALRYNWLSQPFMIFAFATGKISVGFLLLRYNGSTAVWRKWVIYFAMASALLFSSLNIIFTYAQCDKVEALWEPQLVEEGIAHCWPTQIQTDFAIFLGSWNAFIDALLALLPITIFWSLGMTLRQKLALSLLLGLGLIAAVCSAVKTQYLASLNQRSDLLWSTYDLFVWSIAELFVIIACGSVPPMKPLWDLYFRKARIRMTQYQQGGTKTYGSTNNYAYTNDGSTNMTTTWDRSTWDRSTWDRSTWDRSTISESVGYGRSHSYRSEANETGGRTNHATRFDISNAAHGAHKQHESDSHRDSLTDDAYARVQTWSRERAFPTGPQSLFQHDRPSLQPPGRHPQPMRPTSRYNSRSPQPQTRPSLQPMSKFSSQTSNVSTPQRMTRPTSRYNSMSPPPYPQQMNRPNPQSQPMNWPSAQSQQMNWPNQQQTSRGTQPISQYNTRPRLPRSSAPRADSSTLPIPYENT